MITLCDYDYCCWLIVVMMIMIITTFRINLFFCSISSVLTSLGQPPSLWLQIVIVIKNKIQIIESHQHYHHDKDHHHSMIMTEMFSPVIHACTRQFCLFCVTVGMRLQRKWRWWHCWSIGLICVCGWHFWCCWQDVLKGRWYFLWTWDTWDPTDLWSGRTTMNLKFWVWVWQLVEF